MSSIGTGIATSVAQVAQTARQSAAARDKARADVQRAAQAGSDQFAQRLRAAAEADDPDAELPDRPPLGYEQLYLSDGDGQPLADPPTLSPAEPDPAAVPSPHPPHHPLYQHLDVTA
jgi:hypothetical protein